jgi:hypothetical protein
MFAPKILVQKYWLQLCDILSLHEDACGKRFVSFAPLFIAPRRCSWKMTHFSRATKKLRENTPKHYKKAVVQIPNRKGS